MTPAHLALALYMFGVTVIEPAGRRFARARGPWPGTAPALACALWAGLVTGSVAASFTVGVAMMTAGLALAAAGRYLGHGAAQGLITVLAPYGAIWGAWAALRPPVHPWLLRAAFELWSALAGARPASIEALVALTVVGTAFLFNIGQGTALVRAVLLGLEKPDPASGSRAGAAAVQEAAASIDPAVDGLYRAGEIIGNLERFLILLLVLQGQLEAIGFVVAAKSIARFEMIRERAEYFLVGTLASVTVALTSGLLCRAVLG